MPGYRNPLDLEGNELYVDGNNDPTTVGGTVYHAGLGGYYWSGSVANGTDARELFFYKRDINLDDPGARAAGFSVRCIKELEEEYVSLPEGITINNASAAGVVVTFPKDIQEEIQELNNNAGVVYNVVDNNANIINLSMSYTVTGSLKKTLPAYSKTFTIDITNSEDSVVDIKNTEYSEEVAAIKKAKESKVGVVATFSWLEQTLKEGSGTFNATIRTNKTYNAKKLDVSEKVVDVSERVVATFSYPMNSKDSPAGTAKLKIMPGILDRMFGKADNNGDADTHKFVYVPVTNPITGRTWLSNNLGAEYADSTNPRGNYNPAQQATAKNDYKAYGSLFQWGRKADGHEFINWANRAGKSGITTKNSNNPTDTLFIVSNKSPYDWRANQDGTLWESESSANNVCPAGYRLPTAGFNRQKKEWEVEVDSWHTGGHGSTTSTHALASTLRLSMAGARWNTNGVVDNVGSFGYYWSSSLSTITSRHLAVDRLRTDTSRRYYRTIGFSVRCIKDR
jgi:uncharacterized protein (TIGR02145 family)